MKTIKRLSLFLALILSISTILPACSKVSEQEDGKTASETTVNKENSNEASKPAKKEKLSFRITTVYFGDNTPEGTPIQEAWIKMLSEKMGKELDIKFEYIHTGDYNDKLQVINAGGDLPDILTFYSTKEDTKTAVDRYGSQGLYVNLADYLDKMPNYKAALEKDPTSKKSLFTPEGKLFGFYNLCITPTGSAHGAESTMMAVKNSVLKENNLKVPTTLDEIYQVAKVLKEKGVSKYPIVQHEEWQNPEGVVFRAYHTGEKRFYNGTEFEYGPLSEDYKLSLQYLNKIYTEGLISPDYFTYTTDNGNQTIADGSACIIPSAWEGYPGMWATERAAEEWVAVPQPSSDKYPDEVWQFEREFPTEYAFQNRYSMVISSQSKVVDELIQFMDLQYDKDIINLLNWGIEGETYQVGADGKKEFLLGGATNKDKLVATGLPAGGDRRAGIFPQPQDMDLWRIALADAAPIYWNGEIVNEKLVAFSSGKMDAKNTCPRDWEPKPALTTEEASEYANMMTPVETYAKEQKVKFIKGERSFDEWDQYLEELNKMGDIQAAMNIYNSKLN